MIFQTFHQTVMDRQKPCNVAITSPPEQHIPWFKFRHVEATAINIKMWKKLLNCPRIKLPQQSKEVPKWKLNAMLVINIFPISSECCKAAKRVSRREILRSTFESCRSLSEIPSRSFRAAHSAHLTTFWHLTLHSGKDYATSILTTEKFICLPLCGGAFTYNCGQN